MLLPQSQKETGTKCQGQRSKPGNDSQSRKKMTGKETRPQGSQERREEIPALHMEFTSEVPQAAELLWPKHPARQQGASSPQGLGLAGSQLCSVSTSLIMHPGRLQRDGPHPLLFPPPIPPAPMGAENRPLKPRSSNSCLAKTSQWGPGIIYNCRVAQGKYLMPPDSVEREITASKGSVIKIG